MSSRDELTAMLKVAKTAYHELVIGGSVRVMVHQNGSRVEYTAANRAALSAYISDLERQLGGTTSGPMSVYF